MLFSVNVDTLYTPSSFVEGLAETLGVQQFIKWQHGNC